MTLRIRPPRKASTNASHRVLGPSPTGTPGGLVLGLLEEATVFLPVAAMGKVTSYAIGPTPDCCTNRPEILSGQSPSSFLISFLSRILPPSADCASAFGSHSNLS